MANEATPPPVLVAVAVAGGECVEGPLVLLVVNVVDEGLFVASMWLCETAFA